MTSRFLFLIGLVGLSTACNAGGGDDDGGLDGTLDGVVGRVDAHVDGGPAPDRGRDAQPSCRPECGDRRCGPDGCGGECGSACEAPKVCRDGMCSAEGCAPGTFECAGVCVDLLTDLENCGSCQNRCPRREGTRSACIDAECHETCLDMPADSPSIDFETDVDNCGQCGAACPVVQDHERECIDGACVDPCAPLAICQESCVDTQTDPDHCGACDRACPVIEGGRRICEDGACVDPCAPLATCDGRCVDLASDVDHCGACDAACPLIGGGERACVDGACADPCGGRAVCDGQCVDLQTDDQNCGACGQACDADTTCREGICRCRAAGHGMCDDQCIPLTTVDNCGGCGVVCPGAEGGEARCENQACANPCGDGLACEGVCRDTPNDFQNCGACDRNCASVARELNAMDLCPPGTRDCEFIARDCVEGDCAVNVWTAYRFERPREGGLSCDQVCEQMGMQCRPRLGPQTRCYYAEQVFGSYESRRIELEPFQVGCATWTGEFRRGYGRIDRCDQVIPDSTVISGLRMNIASRYCPCAPME